MHSTRGSVVVLFLFFSLAICLEVRLSISLLEASSNLCHICEHMTGALKHTHHQEIIINQEVESPPEHQIMWQKLVTTNWVLL